MNNLKMCPAFKDYLWGGVKLKEKYGKISDLDVLAESWELSYHKDGETKTEFGKTLSEALSDVDLGKNAVSFPFFPVLIKFIDAKSNLSVQVHPSDEYALKNENSFGKTEMWYIVEADEGAGIYLGFKETVTEAEVRKAIDENSLTELLNFFPVSKGECYFIPSGTIHAIGAGCLICEIQQNSNLTYRVYDYGRKDKNGNTRELHVEKALAVSDLNRFEYKPLNIEMNGRKYLGISKYFSVSILEVTEEYEFKSDSSSFTSICCVCGSGYIGNEKILTGDTRLLTASNETVLFKGDMKLIMTQIRKYYVGIDLGGTFIKGGIIDDLGNILVSDKVPTEANLGGEKVVENIAALANKLIKMAGLTNSDIEGVGIGSPGMIDSGRGIVLFSNNLGWRDFAIAEKVSSLTGIPAKVANDANLAVLGEVKFGAAKDKTNVIMLTLGTGVGGGIVCNGQLVEGNFSVGAELGHAVIVKGGEPCSCGRRGCLEAYASATALIRDTKKAMEKNPSSKMWEIGSLDNVTGKTAFDYKDCDESAKEVVENYLSYLASGIANYGNIFRPEVVILGGGVCAQGDDLIIPLQKLVDKEVYAENIGPQVKLVIAELGNSAGMLGAASLFM